MRKIVRDIILIVGISALIGLGVNALSPAGIALMGEWDPSQGVVADSMDGPIPTTTTSTCRTRGAMSNGKSIATT